MQKPNDFVFVAYVPFIILMTNHSITLFHLFPVYRFHVTCLATTLTSPKTFLIPCEADVGLIV